MEVSIYVRANGVISCLETVTCHLFDSNSMLLMARMFNDCAPLLLSPKQQTANTIM